MSQKALFTSIPPARSVMDLPRSEFSNTYLNLSSLSRRASSVWRLESATARYPARRSQSSMPSRVNLSGRWSFIWRRPILRSPSGSGMRATDSYPSPLHRFRVLAWRSASVVVASRREVLLLQKLPLGVKKGLAGSKRPQITLPHMHSSRGSPLLSRKMRPSSSLAQRLVSSATNSAGKPRVS